MRILCAGFNLRRKRLSITTRASAQHYARHKKFRNSNRNRMSSSSLQTNHNRNLMSTMSISKLKSSQRMDSDRSLNTESTHQGDMSPSPKPHAPVRRESSTRRIIQRLRKTPSQRTPSQLFMPDLDADTEPMKKQAKVSLWTSKFMTIVYLSIAASYLLNTNLFLSGIPLLLLMKIAHLTLKWSNFFGEDPYLKNALKFYSRHHKRAMKELHRSKEGGFFRRRQEAIMAGASFQSMLYWENYFSKKSSEIGERLKKERRDRKAEWKQAFPSGLRKKK